MRKSDSYKRTEQIKVYLWGRFVGAVAMDPALGYYAFAYDKMFGKSGIEISPLHLPLNDEERVYIFTDLPEATYKRLPAMLSDVLPDDFGNALINRYMAEKGISPATITSLDRLAYMGKRAMGALEFKPVHGPRNINPVVLEMDSLVSEARKAIKGSLKNDDQAKASLRSIIDVGSSAGGARAKAVIAWNPETQEIQSGQMDAQEGFEHWLLKFDGMGKDRELGISEHYGRIEYAYHLMAIQAGISMTEARLLEENDRAHFMSKRFDREGQKTKHHIQTLCGMNHIDYKRKATNSYEQLLMTLIELGLDHEAFVEVFRRMIFNIMGRNCDDHSKNFSFILKQGSSWELAPAYDVTFAHNPHGEWTSQHLMSVNGKFKDILVSDILEVADRFGVGEASQMIREVRSAMESWPIFAHEAGLDRQEINRIAKLHILL